MLDNRDSVVIADAKQYEQQQLFLDQVEKERRFSKNRSRNRDTKKEMSLMLNLLKTNDLCFESYELRRINNNMVTKYMLYGNGSYLSSCIELHGKIIGFDMLLTFQSIFEYDLSKVQVVSRHELSRKARETRHALEHFKESNYGNFADNMQESARYDNRQVSEILPSYTVTLEDVLNHKLELF